MQDNQSLFHIPPKDAIFAGETKEKL